MSEIAATLAIERSEPYVVSRVVGKHVECALWTLADGTRTIALFLDEAAARAYCQAANLGPAWRAFKPRVDDLLAILRASHEAGIHWAALDPDHDRAKRLFDLREVVAAATETD